MLLAEKLHLLVLLSQSLRGSDEMHCPQTASVGKTGHEQLPVRQIGSISCISVDRMPPYIAALVDNGMV